MTTSNHAVGAEPPPPVTSSFAKAAEETFVHINEWHEHFNSDPCSRTEVIYLDACRSEEPATTNMDISTGHIVLVSKQLLFCGEAAWN